MSLKSTGDGRPPFLRHYGVRWLLDEGQPSTGWMLGQSTLTAWRPDL